MLDKGGEGSDWSWVVEDKGRRVSAGTLGVLDKGGEGSDWSWVAEDKGRRGSDEVPIPPYFCSIIFKQ